MPRVSRDVPPPSAKTPNPNRKSPAGWREVWPLCDLASHFSPLALAWCCLGMLLERKEMFSTTAPRAILSVMPCTEHTPPRPRVRPQWHKSAPGEAAGSSSVKAAGTAVPLLDSSSTAGKNKDQSHASRHITREPSPAFRGPSSPHRPHLCRLKHLPANQSKMVLSLRSAQQAVNH